MFVPIVPQSHSASRPRRRQSAAHPIGSRPSHREFRRTLRARDFRAPPRDDGSRETARLIITVILIVLFATGYLGRLGLF